MYACSPKSISRSCHLSQLIETIHPPANSRISGPAYLVRAAEPEWASASINVSVAGIFIPANKGVKVSAATECKRKIGRNG